MPTPDAARRGRGRTVLAMTSVPRAAGAALAGLLCLAAMAPWSVASGQVEILAADLETKPADPLYSHLRTEFDCTARDTLSLAPGLELTLQDDTSDGDRLIPSYACAPWSENGPEHIYRLEVDESVVLRAALSDLGDEDLDLFLLEGCDSDLCAVGANVEFRAELAPGTYYLVVDGYGTGAPAAGPYTLTLQTLWPGVPDAICQEGGAEDVLCAGATIEMTGNIFGLPDLIQEYDCTASVLRGGEQWYRIELPGLHEVTVIVSPNEQALDPALWLFDGCGEAAACLDFRDARIGGQSESLTVVNEAETPTTVILAVDAQRPAADEITGAFGVSFACQSNVATERTSLGSLRALYR